LKLLIGERADRTLLRAGADQCIVEAVFQLADTSAVDAILEEVHGDIGTEALRIWGLPSHLVGLCQRHHDAVLESGDGLEELHALRVVDGLSRLACHAGDLSRLDQTRRSMEALHMDRVRTRMLHKAILEQQARVLLMFPG